MTVPFAIAAYVRISSDKQAVARQRESIERWAERAGVTISLWFEDSVGRNSRDMPHKRQGFQRLLKAVEAGLVSCIVVDSQDRFGSRDAHQWGGFLTTLRDHGCTLYDASGKDLSADDDATVLTTTIGALASTREQREKAHRSLTGKIAKAKAGEYQGGNPPYGFDVVCFGVDGKERWRSVYIGHYKRWKVYPDGTREPFNGQHNSPRKDATDTLCLRPSIVKERTKIARQIFEWYATEAISPGQIATRLRQLDVDAVFGDWNKVKVKQLLKHPIYIGFPTWNKSAQSRFAEFVDGQVREVARVNGKAKLGRRRTEADYLQPEKPVFKPLVSREIWDKVQTKIAGAKQGPKRAARTDHLWLKPFLVCGQCGQSMRATKGGEGTRLWPSYFCGTYGTYGKENPTGCRCHRVRHSVIEQIIMGYVNKTAPMVGDLLRATQLGNLELAKPLLERLRFAENGRGGAWLDMLAFVDRMATKRELKKGADLDEQYGLVYERVRPKLEADIAKLEAELDAMLDDYRNLSPKLRERANKRMEVKQAEIEELRRDIEDLRIPWAALHGEVEARKQAFENASAVLANGADGRHKAEALSRVVDRIVCHYRHSGRKSFLEKLEIHAVSGEIACFTNGIAPGPG